ncbi:MAG: SH3 domain-containing protein [Clostridiales bacterium]|nr:SH3 domain-containing protein [Clostridiales bacterium]
MKKVFSFFMALLVAFAMFAAGAETIKLAHKDGSVYLRKGAGTKYSTNGVLKNGAKVTVLKKGSVWSKVKTTDSRTGYVKNLYISGMGKSYASGTTYYSKSYTGTVKTKYASSSVNLRGGAGSSQGKITTLKNGTKVKVLGKNGSWYLVETAKGTQGFVASKYISTKAGGSSSSSSSTKATVANCDAVNMRKSASKDSDKIVVLAKGTSVTVLSKSGSWWKVKYSGKTGYIFSKYLK